MRAVASRGSLSSSYVAAANATDVKIVRASPALPRKTITEADAIRVALAQLPVGSVVDAAELVGLTYTQFPVPRLAWAVAVDPAGSHASAGGGPGIPAPPAYNFEVDFVDATTAIDSSARDQPEAAVPPDDRGRVMGGFESEWAWPDQPQGSMPARRHWASTVWA